MRSEPPPRKGAIGKEMFKRWAQSVGLEVRPAPSGSACDCIADGLEVVIKFGLQWANGTLVFEQIRPQGYDVAALLGLQPQFVSLWLVPRNVLWRATNQQHGAETHWLRFRPSQPPSFLAPFGGTLAAAQASLLEQARGDAGS